MSETGLSIVIPVFNEKEGIGQTIENLKPILDADDFDLEVIVVDDGSQDGTEAILQDLEHPGFRVIRHNRNRGYGAAIKTAIARSAHQLIAITDADGTYPNERIPDMLRMTLERDLDMLVGARSGKDVRIPYLRRAPKWVLKQLARYLTRSEIPDLNSGLRIMRKSVLLRFLNLLPDGFSLTTTITLAMLTNGYNVEYTPISYDVRRGRSKIRPIRDTLGFLQLIIMTVLYFDPLRVFIPLSFSLMLTAAAAYVYRVLAGYGFAVTIPLLFLSGLQLLSIGMLAELIVKRLIIRSADPPVPAGQPATPDDVGS